MVGNAKKKLKTYAMFVKNGYENVCSECLVEQQNKRVPIHERKQVLYPCRVHGDPTQPNGNVLLAWWLYGKMPLDKQLKKGENYINFPKINISVLDTLLSWLGLEDDGALWLELLEVLDNAYTQ